MSAADGVVRTDSTGQAPDLHEAQLPLHGASRAVSPELALVDADLARELRAHLQELVSSTPSPVVVEPVRTQAASASVPRAQLEPTRPARRSRRRSRKLRVLGLVALGALLTVFVRTEQRPSALDRIARAGADPNAEAQTPQRPVSAGTAAADVNPAGQTFVWAAEPGAAAYEFQLFRGAERIYRARVTAPRHVLPGGWQQGTRARALTAATYRWYVWPISARTGRQAFVATVQATLVVARPSR
jgi:hypothetical protein